MRLSDLLIFMNTEYQIFMQISIFWHCLYEIFVSVLHLGCTWPGGIFYTLSLLINMEMWSVLYTSYNKISNNLPATFPKSTINLYCKVKEKADMEKGADTRTLFAEIFENCGNFWIVEDWLLLFWNKTYESWKFLLKYQLFGIFVAFDSINLDTCENFEESICGNFNY